MPRIYSYVVDDDSGKAPNVDGGVCTLAICKQDIRRLAKVGDWIVGLWPAPNNLRVTYVMRVGQKLSFPVYWREFPQKRPGYSKTPDNIYRVSADLKIEQVHNTSHDLQEMKKDLSGLYVLVAGRYWYFGAEEFELTEEFADIDLPLPRRKHRKQDWADTKLAAFVALLESRGESTLGAPRDPSLTSCRRRCAS